MSSDESKVNSKRTLSKRRANNLAKVELKKEINYADDDKRKRYSQQMYESDSEFALSSENSENDDNPYRKRGRIVRGKFTCSICNLSFLIESGLRRHKKRHEPPGGFPCKFCNATFTMISERIEHRETMHKIFNCSLCWSEFKSKEEYVAHVNDEHDGKKRDRFICEECGQTFGQKNQLIVHTKSKCGTVRTYECHICNAKLISQNTLNSHIETHNGEKKFLCKFCGKGFLHTGQLKNHERCHTGEKPYKCNQCNKSFSHGESLITHSSIHTGIKPYACTCCGKQFSCLGNLIKHKRVKPDSCGLPQYQDNKKIAPRPQLKDLGAAQPRTYPGKGKQVFKKNMSKCSKKNVRIPKCAHSALKTEKKIEEDEILSDIDNQTIEIVTKIESDQSNDNDGQSFPITEIILNTEIDTYDLKPEIEFYDPEELEEGEIPSFNAILMPEDDVKFDNYVESEIETIDYKTDVEDAKPLIELIEKQIDEAPTIEKDENQSDKPIQTKDDEKRERTTYECQICGLIYISKKRYKLHVAAHSENIEHKFGCRICLQRFNTKRILEDHMKNVHGGNFTCDICQRKFCSIYTIRTHMRKFHEKNARSNSIHICSKCGRNFASRFVLVNHELSDCGQKPIFKCKLCDKAYNSHGGLKSHILTHTGRLPYTCSYCNKAFRNSHQLKIHVRSHTGQKPLVCEFCQKGFAHRETLLTHLSMHTGIKRFLCQSCGDRFSCISNLKAHRRSRPDTCAQLPIITKPHVTI